MRGWYPNTESRGTVDTVNIGIMEIMKHCKKWKLCELLFLLPPQKYQAKGADVNIGDENSNKTSREESNGFVTYRPQKRG